MNCAFMFNDSLKLTTKSFNQLDYRILIANTYHALFTDRKTLIRTKVTALQTFKAKRTVILTSRKAQPHLNWQLHVHLCAIATMTMATAYTPCLALYPCYHVSNLPNARGRLFYYQIWSVTDIQQTENQRL